MKRWINNWALIDLLSLGAGILLMLYYHFYKDTYDINSSFHALIPNIATEIIGVWVSIRVIEYVYNKRENFHLKRQTILASILEVGQLLEKGFPSPAEWRRYQIENSIFHLKEIKPNAENYVTEDEFQIINNCIESCDHALRLFNSLLLIKNNIKTIKANLDLAVIDINNDRDIIKNQIDEFYNLYFILHGSKNVPIKELIADFKNKLQHFEGSYSSLEYAEVNKILLLFKGKDKIRAKDIKIIPIKSITKATSPVYTYSLKSLIFLDTLYKSIDNQYIYEDSNFNEDLKYSNELVTTDDNTAKNINEYALKYNLQLSTYSSLVTQYFKETESYYFLSKNFKTLIALDSQRSAL